MRTSVERIPVKTGASCKVAIDTDGEDGEGERRTGVPLSLSSRYQIRSIIDSPHPNGSINNHASISPWKLIASQGLSFRKRPIWHLRRAEPIRREGVEEQVDHCPRPPRGDSGPSG